MKIIFDRLSQKEYDLLIDYLRKEGEGIKQTYNSHVVGNYQRATVNILEIESIEKVEGNPPKYCSVCIKSNPTEDISQLKIKLKGLIDLLI